MLLVDDYENLAGRAAGLEKASFKHLLKGIKAESTVIQEMGLSGLKRPEVSVPTFDGKVSCWNSSWEQFDTTIR